jgi:hypothetical protein
VETSSSRGKGKRKLSDEVISSPLPSEQLLQSSYLVGMKTMAICVGNRLNLSEKAYLASRMCPKMEWLKRSDFKDATIAALGCSHTTFQRAMNEKHNKLENIPLNTTIRTIAGRNFLNTDIRDHLDFDKNTCSRKVAILENDIEMVEKDDEERDVGRPRRPTLEELRNIWNGDSAALFLVDWLVDQAPVTSGTRGARRLKFGTWKGAFEHFNEFQKERRIPHMGKQRFKQLLRGACIAPTDYSYFVCPYCLLSDGDQEAQEHRNAVGSSIERYRHLKTGLQPGDLFVVVDFARVHECSNDRVELLIIEKGRLVRKDIRTALSLLGFAVCFENPCSTEFINCCGQLPQTGAFIKLESLTWLISSETRSGMSIGSFCGPMEDFEIILQWLLGGHFSTFFQTSNTST